MPRDIDPILLAVGIGATAAVVMTVIYIATRPLELATETHALASGSHDTSENTAQKSHSSVSSSEPSQNEVYNAIASGNVPGFLRDWKPVPVSLPGNSSITGTLFVSPDYLGIGSDAGYLRTPMYPGTAQRLADELGFMLPTKRIVEAIEAVATPIPFHSHTPTQTMGRNSRAMWELQNSQIQSDIGGRAGELVAGHKKDIVIGKVVANNPGKVIIFGGKYADGTRVQSQSAAHNMTYEDYSHGVRMIRPDMIVTENGVGRGMLVRDVLADPRLAGLVSGEGATSAWRYPT